MQLAHHCPGVRRLILNGERPAEIADYEVDDIKKHSVNKHVEAA
jgi:hypothetical protein